jgi:hypothetical protein
VPAKYKTGAPKIIHRPRDADYATKERPPSPSAPAALSQSTTRRGEARVGNQQSTINNRRLMAAHSANFAADMACQSGLG